MKKKPAAAAAIETPSPPRPPQPSEPRSVPFGTIYPSPLNPRKGAPDEAALEALAASIVAEGLLQPLLVRPRGIVTGDYSEGFEIIAGERRFNAIRRAIAGGTLPPDYPIAVRVRDATDAELVELAATENMARADMSPLDEAEAIAAMRRYHSDDEEIARRLGLPLRPSIAVSPS